MKFYKIMTLFLLTMSPFMLSAGIFDNIENHEQIAKVHFNPESLKGKVIFFEYWGVNYQSSKSSIPHLVNLQRQYAKTGKFTVITSQLHYEKEKTLAFLKFANVNFPVFQYFRSQEAPCGEKIPYAYIIDHTGKVVDKGYPSMLYKKVKDFVENAPPPLLRGAELNYWKNLEDDIEKAKSYTNIIKDLKKASSGNTPKAEEAKQIVEILETNLNKRYEDLKEASNETPVEMMNEIEKFASKTKGMPIGKSANALYLEIKSDQDLKKVQKLQKEIDKIISKVRGHRSKNLFKKSKAIKVKLTKLQESKSSSERAKKAAGNLIDYMDSQI